MIKSHVLYRLSYALTCRGVYVSGRCGSSAAHSFVPAVEFVISSAQGQNSAGLRCRTRTGPADRTQRLDQYFAMTGPPQLKW